MKVRMNIHIEGTRNGVRWPAIDGEVDLPEGEANDLIGLGYAEAVKDEPVKAAPKVEKAVAPKPETRKKS